MTGFGQAKGRINGASLQVEARSVNHRFLETVVRMPREWQRHERVVKEIFQRLFARGRIEIHITAEPDEQEADSVVIDWALAEAYIQASSQLKERYQLSGTLSLSEFMQLPGVVTQRDVFELEEEHLVAELGRTVQLAAEQLLAMRKDEGRHLYTELNILLKDLISLHHDIHESVPNIQRMLHERLSLRLEELLQNISLEPERLHVEAAILAERADIREELTRLESHLTQARALLETGGVIGRKLDFLLQEMNREANTMGAKAGSAGLSNNVVELKSLIEKFREQVQNIQ